MGPGGGETVLVGPGGGETVLVGPPVVGKLY